MIRSIQHKGLKLLWTKSDDSKLSQHLVVKIRLVLQVIHYAVDIKDVDAPGFGLHQLKGKLSGFWSVTVSGNYRIIFEFKDGDAYLLDFVDYH